MSDAAGLPASNRWTLRYLDPAVEREFGEATSDAARQRLALAAVVNVPVWIVGAILAPILVPSIDPRIAYGTAIVMTTLLIASALWALRPRSRAAIDRVLYSEQVEPAAAVEMLNDAFAAAIPVVRDAGGTIVQFAGDAMMVIWNAPRRQPDHARLACLAALGLQRATVHLGADPGHPRFRVGVNTGPALVGNIGSDDARSFTAIGDATNLAARLQTFAPPGSVAVGPRTWELVEAAAECRDLGPQPLKGKAEPVRIRELIAIHDLPGGHVPSDLRDIPALSTPG